MGFKHQVLSTRRPEEIVGVTLNHLQSLRNVVSSQAPVVELVDEAIARVHSTFDDMSEADFAVLRQTLVNFLQDRRVKVSIFLQESIQASDGSITIPPAGRLAFGMNPPGQVRYYAGGDLYRTADLPIAGMHAWTAPTTTSANGEGALGLGVNMYERTGTE